MVGTTLKVASKYTWRATLSKSSILLLCARKYGCRSAVIRIGQATVERIAIQMRVASIQQDGVHSVWAAWKRWLCQSAPLVHAALDGAEAGFPRLKKTRDVARQTSSKICRRVRSSSDTLRLQAAQDVNAQFPPSVELPVVVNAEYVGIHRALGPSFSRSRIFQLLKNFCPSFSVPAS